MKTIKYLGLGLLLISRLGFSQTLSAYPNPFIQSSTVEFVLNSPDTTSLSIIDITGQIVRTILNDTFLPTAHYSYVVSGDSLVSGMYVIKLRRGDTSETVRVVKLSGTTEVSSLDNDDNFMLFPNPVRDKLFINGNIENMDVTVFDVMGRHWSAPHARSEIDVTSLLIGLYYLNIIGDDVNVIKKFIKQ
ncbi:MAG: C-terminal target protein [Bacteroidetes bacterium]|nr:C-terminal target protein [Bacteroidota bacterium]